MASKLTWRDAIPTGRTGPAIRTSITAAEARALRRLARDSVVVEIGSAYGYSTVVMALVARRVISIDPHTGLEDSEQVLRHNLAAFDVAKRYADVVALHELTFEVKAGELVALTGCSGAVPSVVVPWVKVTTPVGAFPVITALNVTGCP